MNSSPSRGASPVPQSKPENENDDPVGDNGRDRASGDVSDAEPLASPDADREADDPSNSGAVRTGNDAASSGQSPKREPGTDDEDADADADEEELPEGSDVPAPDKSGNAGSGDRTSNRAARGPTSGANLPQTSRG